MLTTIIAELLSKASNHDALLLHVCMICIYVYPSHSTRDTSIVQLPAFIDTAHDSCYVHCTITGHDSAHHITSSLYAAFSPSFPLPFTESHAKWLLRICHFGCRHSCCVAQTPAPGCQLESTETRCERQRSYIFSLLFDRRTVYTM